MPAPRAAKDARTSPDAECIENSSGSEADKPTLRKHVNTNSRRSYDYGDSQGETRTPLSLALSTVRKTQRPFISVNREPYTAWATRLSVASSGIARGSVAWNRVRCRSHEEREDPASGRDGKTGMPHSRICVKIGESNGRTHAATRQSRKRTRRRDVFLRVDSSRFAGPEAHRTGQARQSAESVRPALAKRAAASLGSLARRARRAARECEGKRERERLKR
jgi:hypothetical protein